MIRRFRLAAASLTVAASLLLAATAGGERAAAIHGGALSTRFGTRGVVTLGAGTRLFGVTVEHDGDTVAVGESGAGIHTRLLLVRLTAAGRLDRSFGHGGLVTGPAVRSPLGSGSLGRAVTVLPDGRIVVVGTATRADGSAREGMIVECYGAGGALDRAFGKSGVVDLDADSFGDGYAVAVEPNGLIVAGGSVDASGSGNGTYPRATVAVLHSGGAPDRSFGHDGVAVIDLGPYSYAYAVGVASGGRIVLAGSASPDLRATVALLARLTPTGSLDHSFDRTTRQYSSGGAFSEFRSLAISGGQITVAGSATGGGETSNTLLARFSSSGRPVGSFGSGGSVQTRAASDYLGTSAASTPGASAVLVTTGGEVLAAGVRAVGVSRTLAVWGFNSRGQPAGGFGVHGLADLDVPVAPNGEASAIALSPTGTAIAAGDARPFTGSYRGLLASYGA